MGEFSISRVVASTATIYLFLNMYAWGIADGMLFHPQPSSYKDNDKIIKLTTSDGEKISAIFLKNPNAKFTILHSHGNAEDIGEVLPSMQNLHALGFSVLLYDYRGYGTSEGKPSEKNSYKDIDAAYDWLVNNQGIPSKSIIVHGRSVGGGPATYLAEKHDVGGLILESTFTSAFRVKTYYRILPIDKFDNLGRIKKVKCPVLVIHGTNDRTLPLWHGKKLYDKALNPKMNLWVELGTHNDLTLVAGNKYSDAFVNFAKMVAEHQADQ